MRMQRASALSFNFASESKYGTDHASTSGRHRRAVTTPLTTLASSCITATVQRLRANIEHVLEEQSHKQLKLYNLSNRILRKATDHVTILRQSVLHITYDTAQIKFFTFGQLQAAGAACQQHWASRK